MPNTNFQTIFQMGQAINDMVKQATGRDVVKAIEMGQVTVAQNHTAVDGSASGVIAEFITNSELPIQIIAGINPVQDFNGYEYPWAGGAGKNKLKFDSESFAVSGSGITCTYTDDGVITISGRATSTAYIGWVFPLKAGTYIISGGYNNSNFSMCIRDSSTAAVLFDSRVTGAGEKEFTVPQNYVQVSFSITVANGTNMGTGHEIKPMIRDASVSDSSFEPYSNICPITGWTETIIDHTGKNLVYDSLSNANIDGNGEIFVLPSNTSSLCFAKVIEGITYAINRTSTTLIAYFDDAPGDGSVAYDRTNHFITNTFTAPITGYVAVRVTADEVATFQIEKGTESSDYEPYAGNTYRIEFPSEAGTIYGGTLTVNKDGIGELLVEWDNIASYDGEELPGVWISDRDVYEEGTTPTTGAQVVYELSTPSEPITLEASIVESLIGINNVWASTGNVTVNYTNIIEGGGN